MWLLAFETLLKFRKQQTEDSGDLAERLRQKEEELQKKIEEVDLYRNSKKKKKPKKGKKKKSEEPDTDGEEEKKEVI